jgi:hypothetical protein
LVVIFIICSDVPRDGLFDSVGDCESMDKRLACLTDSMHTPHGLAVAKAVVAAARVGVDGKVGVRLMVA